MNLPFIIDEIQYAPQLQARSSNFSTPAILLLVGSTYRLPNFQIMTGVSETLAGHVAILNLHGLSMEEKGVTHPASPQVYFEHLLETGFPKLQGVRDRTVHDLYLSSCLQTHIERDSRELYRVEKRREFEAFVRLCAFRIGQVINYQGLGREAMVSSATAKERLSLLEGGFLIKLVYPWVRNLAS